jgi:hypothetical protein
MDKLAGARAACDMSHSRTSAGLIFVRTGMRYARSSGAAMNSMPCSWRFRCVVGAFALAAATRTTEAHADGSACETPQTWCSPTSGYDASEEDQREVAREVTPLLRDLRECSATAAAASGAALPPVPTVSLRWDLDGNPVSVSLDVSGYERLPCAGEVFAKLSQFHWHRAAAFQCELSCSTPLEEATLDAILHEAGDRELVRPVESLGTPPPPAAPEHVTRYGWQTAAADGLSFMVILAGAGAGSQGVAAAGLVGYVTAAPLVHLGHGNVGSTLGSLGLRVAMPATAAFLSELIAHAGSSNEQVLGTSAALGLMAGMAGASVIDAVVLAKAKEQPGPSGHAPQGSPRVTVAPSITALPNRADVGVRGTF